MNLPELVKSKFPNLIIEAFDNRGDATVIARREGIRTLMQSLKADPEFDFNMLMDVFVVDYLFWEEKANRFEVVYNLYSLTKKHRLFVKAPLPETEAVIDSVVSVWPAADWFEREAWDMFGVKFAGHPNLKRILMYEGFEGHALRKDYPYNRRQPLIGPQN